VVISGGDEMDQAVTNMWDRGLKSIGHTPNPYIGIPGFGYKFRHRIRKYRLGLVELGGRGLYWSKSLSVTS
jgi:hypothetical protein